MLLVFPTQARIAASMRCGDRRAYAGRGAVLDSSPAVGAVSGAGAAVGRGGAVAGADAAVGAVA